MGNWRAIGLAIEGMAIVFRIVNAICLELYINLMHLILHALIDAQYLYTRQMMFFQGVPSVYEYIAILCQMDLSPNF